MNAQTVIAIVVVAIAGLYCLRKLYRIFKGREQASCAFCDQCPACKEKDPPKADPPCDTQ